MDRTEFDRFADEYYSQHAKSVALSGETPEFFYEYKIRVTARLATRHGISVQRILDFGAGVGNSLPYLRNTFAAAELTCADVSRRSLELSAERFPGVARYVQIDGDRLPLANHTVDLAFSACVFHHISHAEHTSWLAELRRVCRPGALVCIFEHNPWNPLTRKVVRECPFDEHAKLISAPAMCRALAKSGWLQPAVQYTLFFPHALRSLRPTETWLGRVPLGAQYVAYAFAP
jgi:ubiquinone/menaquinone biosynthesis C-methylase UbiE